jgi:hypothetical protein
METESMLEWSAAETRRHVEYSATGRDGHKYYVWSFQFEDDDNVTWVAMTTGPHEPLKVESSRVAQSVCSAWENGDSDYVVSAKATTTRVMRLVGKGDDEQNDSTARNT